MAALVALTTLLAVTEPVTAAIILAQFHDSYWFADGVAIGRVVGEQGQTVDIQVEDWIRDRTEQHEGQIRAYRYSKPSCVLGSGRAESYSSEAKYLFLVRQPYDAGAGQIPYWSILEQFLLDGSTLCVSLPPMSRVERPNGECKPNLREVDLLDAVRTFEDCFDLYDDPILGTYPIKQTCSERRLRAWRKRSLLHEILAATAIKRVSAHSPVAYNHGSQPTGGARSTRASCSIRTLRAAGG